MYYIYASYPYKGIPALAAGGEMAAAISSDKLSKQPGAKEEETSQPAQEPQREAPKEGGLQELHEEQPLLPHNDKDGRREPEEAEQAVMGNGTSEQALQQESDKADKGEKDAGGAGRAAAEPLSWGTRIAQKLFIQVCRCSYPLHLLHAKTDIDKQLTHACHDGKWPDGCGLVLVHEEMLQPLD